MATERQAKVTQMRVDLNSIQKAIGKLTKEPLDPEKVKGLIVHRRTLNAMHAEATALRDKKLREDIEHQRERVRTALGLDAPVK